MFLFLSRLHIDTAERCGIFGVLFYTILFHFILFCWNKEMETLFTHFFFFRVTQGFFTPGKRVLPGEFNPSDK